MTTCKKTYRYICENLDANLNSPTCIEIKKHLDNCPNCNVYLNTLKKTILLYKKQKSPTLGKSARKGLMLSLNLKKTSKTPKKRNISTK